jgi:hypothetical protein
LSFDKNVPRLETFFPRVDSRNCTMFRVKLGPPIFFLLATNGWFLKEVIDRVRLWIEKEEWDEGWLPLNFFSLTSKLPPSFCRC